jgi:hypothetical protein
LLNQNIKKEFWMAIKIVVGVLLAIISLYFGAVALHPSVPDNCWSHYSTEQSAIEHCENHD